ncbi:hypothetical protein JY651_45655 [Pyxidicoccus parkwayensis]|uniref:Uncharacterized protein n=1 Tax=Pyxidicoccus parkwayensis TaxID=2813578 RepID=A0ABX7NTX8_9BACT|nr:hypothetical protein [Pyxidicoccus parkwaysis]QSQ22334.1 hypothetical protein JY651_45655 [Pyxidicoccus parkwaysis]
MTDEERAALTGRATRIIQLWEDDGYDNAREAWTAIDEVLEQRQFLDRELVQRLDAIQNVVARMVANIELGDDA